jgi:uncharacterized CHY-type Zn-finger protein
MASITCGHCRNTHTNVAEVRACARQKPLPPRVMAAERRREYREPAAEGFYQKNGSVFKVQMNLAGTRRYAKVLEVVEGVDTLTGEDSARGQWVIARGAVYQLSTEHKLSKEQAAEFGKLYGVCCICGRRLTNEESIAAGIGPICSGKMGW